ncbi:helix-turn-helix domain-containing protein [Pseudomonas putida]
MFNAFNTSSIDQRQRLAYWTEAICETFLAVDCRQQPGSDLHGEMKGCYLGGLDLIDVVSPPMEYRRELSQLKSHHEEHFQLVLQVYGTGLLQQHGRQAVMLPGDVALYTAMAPSSIAYPRGSRTIAVKIPRASVLSRIACAEQALALSLKAGSPFGAMLGSMMRESLAWSLEKGGSDDARLPSGMLDIMCFAFESAASLSAGSTRRSPLEQIKRYMHTHLGDPELSLGEVASKHNVSMRTLNRLFAAEGLSANRWLWQQRLEASYKALTGKSVRQVSEAALDCGFNDLSHFSRTFKKTYGVTPNQLLRQ